MQWNLKSRQPKWYDITALLDPAVVSSASGVRVRRKDDRIEYSFGNLRPSVNGGIILPWGVLPIGYRPTWNQYGALRWATGAQCEITVNTGGGLVISGSQAGQQYHGNFIVWTDAAQPTTHPGTEVA